MARTRTKVAPTQYPFLPFHGLRLGQLVASLVVGSIMYFFDWYLVHEGSVIPWTFILLTLVAALTTAFLAATTVLYCCCGLNSRLSLFSNALLLAIWGLGFGLLSWWAHGTLTHWCSIEHWKNDAGIMICRMYKALFAFTMLGFTSTLFALALDIRVYRRSTARGQYNQMLDPNAPPSSRADGPVKLGRYNVEPKDGAGEYSVPEEQFDYDTSYQGRHT